MKKRPVNNAYYIGIGISEKSKGNRDYLRQAKDNALNELASEITINISSEIVDIITVQSGMTESENIDSSNVEVQPEDRLEISDDIEFTIEGPDRENLASVTSAILKDGVKEHGLRNIRKIKRFINTFRLLYEIGSESGLLRKFSITPQQLGYFLYFHLFNKKELEMQVSYMKNLSRLQLEIDETIEAKEKPKNNVTDKLNIVFTDSDNREIEKYRILDEFVRGSVR